MEKSAGVWMPVHSHRANTVAVAIWLQVGHMFLVLWSGGPRAK